MAAYVIVNITITDPAIYADYIKAAPASIARFGGRYIVRGGKAEQLEGSYAPKRLVVVEFPTYENARAWWGSEDYASARALRLVSADADMILVDGMTPPPA